MRLLFVTDHRFVPGDGAVYSPGQFPAAIWDRYRAAFEHIAVLARYEGTPPFPRGQLQRSDASGVTFHLAPSLSSLRAQWRERPRARRLLDRLLAEVDAVAVRLPSEWGVLAAQQARRRKKPWAVEVSACAWDQLRNHGRRGGALYAPVMASRMRRVVAAAPYALYVTDGFLQRRYPCRRGVSWACAGVAIPAPDRSVLAQRLARIEGSPEPLVLGLIGSLRVRYKGLGVALRALRRCADRGGPELLLRVAGDGDPGPWRAEAERLGVADRVRFDGVLPGREAVFQWLDGIDLYLQPSFQEGLPRALVEAMSRGCPALATRCGGIPGLLEPECLVRRGDARALGGLLARAARDPGWQAQQARRNWETAGAYAAERLDARRTAFWQAFADYAGGAPCAAG